MSARALTEARRMLHLGVCPVPIPHGQKFPSIEWKPFQKERPTVEQLERLFSGETGIGIVCGAVSGGLVALDFDNSDAYRYWWDKHGRNLTQPVIDRRGARYHVYVRTTEPVPSGKLFVHGFEGPAGDLLSEGKLCVIPPTIHPDGTPREWLYEPRHGFQTVTLESLGVHLRETPKMAYPLDTVNRTATGDRPGDAFNASASWAEVLEPHGWRYAGRCGTYHGWTRPGKPSGISAASGLGSRGQDLLYVFSSNAGPLQPDTCYSKFAAMAALEHCGDFASAARSLADQGFGIAEFHSPRSGGSDDGAASSIEHPTGSSLGDDDESEAEARFGHLFRALPEYLADAGDGEPDWVVEGFLPASFLVVLGGNSKAGKSTFMTALAVAVATGEPFAGMPTGIGAVLWCAYEESETERAMVLRMFDSKPDSLYLTHEKLYIDSAEGLAALRYWVTRTSARLLVIDPLYGANQAESLTDGQTARNVLGGLKELCRETNVCAVVLHHITKNTGAGMVRNRIADSNQILAVASMDLLMDVTAEDKERRVRVTGHGRGSFSNQTWVFGSSSETDWRLLAKGAEAEVDGAYREAQILAEIGAQPMTAEQVAERIGVNLGTVRNTLTTLARAKRVVTVAKEGRANVYAPAPTVTTLTVVMGGGSSDLDPAS